MNRRARLAIARRISLLEHVDERLPPRERFRDVLRWLTDEELGQLKELIEGGALDDSPAVNRLVALGTARLARGLPEASQQLRLTTKQLEAREARLMEALAAQVDSLGRRSFPRGDGNYVWCTPEGWRRKFGTEPPPPR